MLGKRCRTIQRTASISQNMGPHYLYHNYNCNHDTTANYAAKQNAEKLSLPSNAAIIPQVPPNIPQIIGFNPMIKSTGAGGGGAGACTRNQSPHSKFVRPAPDQSPKSMYVVRPFPHDMDDDDPARANNLLQHIPPGGGAGAGGGGVSSKRSQITPISALQTLLAAARQISYTSTTDQTPAFNSYPSRNEDSKSCMKAGSASPSSATPSSISAKQGLWQGFSALNEVKSKEINNKHTIVATSEVPKPGPELYYNNVSVSEADFEHLFYVEETSSLATVDDISGQIGSESADQNSHALYLATSPLAPDFTPNSVPLASFLESCFLCKRPLGQGRDIFMYRGERAFCSVECRDKQMRVEERKEKLRHMQSKMNSNVQQQELYTNTNTTSSSNNAPHPQHQHHKHHHHHHQYGSQAYNNKQHRTSLLMPAA